MKTNPPNRDDHNYSAESSMEQNVYNDESMDDIAIEDWLAKHYVERTSSFASIPPQIWEDGTNGSTVRNNFFVSEHDNDDFEEPVMEATIQRAEPTLMTNGDIFVPIVCTTTLPKNQTLIEGVQVLNIKRQTSYFVIGCLFLATFVAIVASMMITRWFVHTGNRNQTSVPLAPENNATTLAPIESLVNKGNTNWTIADAIFYDSRNGDGISLTMVENGIWFLQSVLNRTDINFTFFRFTQAADIQRVDSTLISMFAFPVWNGHVVSGVYFSYLCSYCSVTTHTTFCILLSTEECNEKCSH